jgi:TRAP transporter TAXI family solute receptor
MRCCHVIALILCVTLSLFIERATAQQLSDPPVVEPDASPRTGAPAIAPPRNARAKNPDQLSDGTLPNSDKLNSSTVTVITAPVGGAFPAMGSDMARVLDDGDNLRVLPVIGKGSVQNLVDIMRLKNIDMGFVVADALEFVKKEYKVPNIEQRVSYIVKLFNNDLHIVARKDIKTLRDLAGKKIMAERNLGYFSVRNIFDRLNITADIDSVTDDAGGLQKLLNGQADAWIVSAGKVAPIVRNIKNDDGRFHFVSIPYEQALQGTYLPSTLSNADYPNLVAPGEDVDTLAAPVLLMVYNWPKGSDRYNRVAKFVNALFSKIEDFRQPSRHPKWRDTNIAAVVPGLQRFKAAEDWLVQNRVPRSETVAAPELQRQFDQFLRDNSPADVKTAEQKQLLLRQFLEWQKNGRQ